MAVFMTGGKAPSLVNYVGYLESDGNQYIDTGVYVTEKTAIEFKASSANGNFYVATATGTPRCGIYLVQTGRIDFAFGASGYVSNAFTGLSEPVVVRLENGKITANGAEYTFATQSAFTLSATLPLFRAGSAATAGVLYCCKIYDSGTLVRDFRPCLDPDGVACLYDEVEKKYYYNAGTGEFTAG